MAGKQALGELPDMDDTDDIIESAATDGIAAVRTGYDRSPNLAGRHERRAR